ncbi:MAG: hypothetical protein KC561_17150 [Myxococcales bacterium]|nr:hypothetical protein [Myxococcales bacterium]
MFGYHDSMDEPDDIQIEHFRRMTPAQRLEAAFSLYWSAREMAEAGVRRRHPEWSDSEVDSAVRELFLNART